MNKEKCYTKQSARYVILSPVIEEPKEHFVDFILPAYKARFLKEAVASILNQSYANFRLIVVDDCSPDDIAGIVRSFDDPRISYHRNERNIGGTDLVAAWTAALAYADSEWCILASDDDIYEPTFLAEMIRLSEKYPSCDLLHGRMDIIDGSDNAIRTAEPRAECESAVQFAYNRACLRMDQCAPDFMFRRSAFLEAGGFVSFPLAWYSDDATWFRLARNGVACTPDVQFHFRHSGINISASFDNAKTKLSSGQLFLQWLATFSQTLSPANNAERDMLDALLTGARKGVLREAGYCLGNTTPMTCLRTVFGLDIPFFDKATMLRIALPYFITARLRK